MVPYGFCCQLFCHRWGFGPPGPSAKAFWDMPVLTLRSLAQVCGVEILGDASPFEVCWTLVQSLLGVGDEKTLQILQKRTATLDAYESECSEVFLSMDADLGHLDKEDQDEMKKAKDEHHRKSSSAQKFSQDWVGKKKSITQKKAVQAERTKLKKSKYPPLPSGMPTHAEAKAFLPPAKCSIWRGLSDGTWQCHYPPFSRRSFSWVKHGGGEEACRACLAYLWQTYLTTQSMEPSDCPIAGLLK